MLYIPQKFINFGINFCHHLYFVKISIMFATNYAVTYIPTNKISIFFVIKFVSVFQQRALLVERTLIPPTLMCAQKLFVFLIFKKNEYNTKDKR